MQILDFFKNGILPKECVLCRAKTTKPLLSRDNLSKYLCTDCIIELLIESKIKHFHFIALGDRQQKDKSFYIWEYSNSSRLIKMYKYEKNYFLAKIFSEFIFYSLRNYTILSDHCSNHLNINPTHSNNYNAYWDILCSVPSTKNSIRAKRFNHISMLSKEISKKIKVNYAPDVLVNNEKRKVKRKNQSLLNSKQREKNVLNAFQAKNCKGKRIILFDDICSTKHTIAQAYKALYSAGAKSIDILVLANNELSNNSA